MRVTDIRITDGDGQTVLARVTITIDEMMVVHGMAIMPGRNGGLFLAMPRHRHSDGSSRDTVHPINSDTRRYIEGQVFEAYRHRGKPYA